MSLTPKIIILIGFQASTKSTIAKEIVKKKTAVKTEIVETKQEIVELEDKKENLTIEEKPEEEVKDNILKQTRRGRPKKA